MNQSCYSFKYRGTIDEWDQICIILRKKYPHLRRSLKHDSRLFNHEIQNFCKIIGFPQVENSEERTEAATRTIHVVNADIYDSCVLDILQKLALKRQKTIAQIIQKYILDYPLVSQELLIK